MKYIIYLIILISITISCSTKNELNEIDFSINWFIDYNDGIYQRIKIAVEEKGNRKKDSIIVALSSEIIQKNRAVLNSLNEKNKHDQIESLLVPKVVPQIDVNNIEHYFDMENINKLSLIEIKRRILMNELQSLSNLSQRIGEQDISFDKLDIFFIPDDYSDSKNDKISGRIILTAISERIGESADFYFNHRFSRSTTHVIFY